VALGWPRDRVLVIDDDLGQSGATAENAPAFSGFGGDQPEPRRPCAGHGHEPPGAVVEGLAPALGVVRGIRLVAGGLDGLYDRAITMIVCCWGQGDDE